MRKLLKPALALVLCGAMLVTLVPGAAAANLNTGSGCTNFDDAEVPDSVLSSDCFYIGSQNVTFSERDQGHFLLKIARGGSAEEAADLTVKITDVSAKLNKNYTVAVYQDKTDIDVPDDYQSIVEGMTQDPDSVTEQAIGTEEELEQQLQDTQAELQDTQTAEASDPLGALPASASAETAAAASAMDTGDSAASVYADDPLAQAKALYTGTETDRQPMSYDTAAAAQASNETSNAIVGESYGYAVTVSFAAGESVKYLSFTPKYSSAADGDMTFVVTLQDCTSGTISALSTVEGTITDTDTAQPIQVGFAATELTADADSVQVQITRKGSINDMAAVTLTSEDGTAESGRDYSPVNSDLYFPMGIYTRTITVPVRHDDTQDLTFTLKLAVLTGCQVTSDTMTVTIPAASGTGELELEDADTTPLADTSFDLDAAEKISDASWVDEGDGYLLCDTIPKDYYVMMGAKLDLGTNGLRYAYDGVRINWALTKKTNWWYSDGETRVDAYGLYPDSTGYWYYTDKVLYQNNDSHFDQTNTDIYFGTLKEMNLRLFEYTSDGCGRTLKVYSVTPIKRHFDITLKDAQPLAYQNVPQAEAAAYTSAMLENSAYTTLTKLTGDTVSVTATNPNNYARLVGLEVIDNNGKLDPWEFVTSDNNASNTITFTLSTDLIEKLGPYMTGSTPAANGSVNGQLSIRPVFAYRDADLTVKSSDYGTFAGLTAGVQTGYHLGDRLILEPAVNAASASYMQGTGFGFYTQLNANAEPDEGTLNYVDGKKTFTLTNQTNVLTPIFSPKTNSVIVSVKKELVDSGAFKAGTGIFTGAPTLNSVTGCYEYTVVAAGKVNPGSNLVLTAVPSGAGVPVWNEPDNSVNYGGTMFAFTEKSETRQNVISLSLSTDTAQYYSVKGSLYNADVNLLTGREGTNPSIPADGAVIFTNSTMAAAGLDGSFTLDTFQMIPGMSVRALAIYNGSEKLVEFQMPSSGTGTQSAPLSVDKGVIALPSQAYTGAGVATVSIRQEGTANNNGTVVGLTNTKTDFIATVRDGVSYTRDDGTTATEKVTGVSFLILDGTTKQVKYTMSATQGTGDNSNTWTATEEKFGTDSADKYTYGDLIYVQIITDRKMSDAGVDETVYAPLATGYQLISGTQTKVDKLEIGLPVSAADSTEPTLQSTDQGFAEMPLIGWFNTVFQNDYFSLTVEKLPDNAIRVRCGLSTNMTDQKDGGVDSDNDVNTTTDTSGMEDENGNPMDSGNATGVKYKPSAEVSKTHFTGYSDANVLNSAGVRGLYQIMKSRSITKSLKKSYKLLQEQKKNYKLNGDIASTQFAVFVTVGVYCDFAVKRDTDPSGGGFIFLGAGTTASVDLYFAKNIYLFIWVIPFFVGFSGDLNVTADMRMVNYDSSTGLKFLPDFAGWDGVFGTMWNALTFMAKNINFTSMLNVEGTLGVGIAKMCAARGYARFTAGFKYEPQLQERYKDLEYTWGLLVSIDYGVAVDFMGASFPISLKGQFGEDTSWADLVTLGMYEYFHEDGTNGKTGTASAAESLQSSETYEPEIQLEERAANAQWVANSDMELQSAYKTESTQTLEKDGYSQPASQIISLGSGRMLMVFLADDASKADTEITTLEYSIYDGSTWSAPAVIQPDATGDFFPNVCDAGDYVMISWASTPDVTATRVSVSATKAAQAQNMEIYTVLLKKSDGKLGDIDQLTDDNYYDAQPVGVYDATTGDRIVYYLKNSSTSTSLMNYANPDYATDAGSYTTICYMIYDGAKHEWARGFYYDGEGLSQENQDFLTDNWGGQRFLPSPVSGSMEDPLITDFTAAPGYNGIAVYSYTVDMDRDLSTVADRELFVQVYDFETHKTYKPIRITNDSVCQSQPQLVRQGGTDGTTYLFWLDAQNNVKYINVTDLIRYGINDDGTLKTSDTSAADSTDASFTGETEPTADGGYYTLSPAVVDMGADETESTNLSTYKAIVDNDGNIYIVWPQHVKDDEKDAAITGDNGLLEGNYYQEIYATALISSADQKIAEAKNPGAGGSWSLPYQLTDNKMFYDGITGAVDSDGNLMLVYNQFDQTFNSDNTKKPITISNMALQATKLRPCGSVETQSIGLSDETPVGGQVISVGATFLNSGLTAAADGFTANFYRCRDGKKLDSKPLYTYKSTDRLVAASTDSCAFLWKLPADPDGVYLQCEVTENGYESDVSTYTTDPIEMKAEYKLDVTKLEQEGDDFVAEYTVTNTGNAVSTDADVMRVCFDGPYGTAEQYGLDSELLAQQSMAGIEPGQSQNFTTKLDIPTAVFNRSGYIACCLLLQRLGTDSSGKETRETLADSDDANLSMKTPVNIQVNGGTAVDTSVNGTVSLTAAYDTNRLIGSATGVKYSVADSSVAELNGSTLTGKKAGTTTLTVYVEPFGVTKTIAVTVNPITVTQTPGGTISLRGGTANTDGSQTYNIVPDTGYEIADVLVNGVSVGSVFSYTFPAGTDSGSITAVFRQTGTWNNPFTDVNEGDWFYDAVSTVAQAGIMKGTGDTLFSPDLELTRGMFVTMLARFDNADTSNTASGFTDVAADAYYAGAVVWASKNGIVKGVSDTSYAPDQSITREQAVTMLCRYASYARMDVSAAGTTDLSAFTDAGEVSDYALPALRWAVGTGLIKGMTPTAIGPKSTATRAQAAQIFANFIRYTQSLKG